MGEDATPGAISFSGGNFGSGRAPGQDAFSPRPASPLSGSRASARPAWLEGQRRRSLRGLNQVAPSEWAERGATPSLSLARAVSRRGSSDSWQSEQGSYHSAGSTVANTDVTWGSSEGTHNGRSKRARDRLGRLLPRKYVPLAYMMAGILCLVNVLLSVLYSAGFGEGTRRAWGYARNPKP